jgi:hypothetical protein
VEEICGGHDQRGCVPGDDLQFANGAEEWEVFEAQLTRFALQEIFDFRLQIELPMKSEIFKLKSDFTFPA